MLTVEEIKQFIEIDAVSELKKQARKGEAYYNAEHDIKDTRIFYFNKDGTLIEDKTRNNAKISHPFFTELVDQATMHLLSGEEGFVKSKIPELQAEMDAYFNENEDFAAEFAEVITGCQVKGFDYMFAYKNAEDRTAFQCADSIGVIEVEARFADDGKDHVIYWYTDRVDKDGKEIKKIMDWDDEATYCYKQSDNGEIEPDDCAEDGTNVKPHIVYQAGKNGAMQGVSLGYIPFFRLDNNKKKVYSLKPVKDIIDDYDLHSSSLTNNLVDFDAPIYGVKGFLGDNLDELALNLKSRKVMGLPEEGEIEVHTIEIPYQARKEKLEIDEKDIYQFGMGLNTAGLKDTNATTNMTVKTLYALLDIRCSKLRDRIKQFLRKIIKVVLDEINEKNGTDYQQKDIYFNFKPEYMTNKEENARIELTQAQKRQTEINTLLGLATRLDNETVMKLICEQLDVEWEEIKNKLPDPDEANTSINDAQNALNGVVVEGGEPNASI